MDLASLTMGSFDPLLSFVVYLAVNQKLKISWYKHIFGIVYVETKKTPTKTAASSNAADSHQSHVTVAKSSVIGNEV